MHANILTDRLLSSEGHLIKLSNPQGSRNKQKQPHWGRNQSRIGKERERERDRKCVCVYTAKGVGKYCHEIRTRWSKQSSQLREKGICWRCIVFTHMQKKALAEIQYIFEVVYNKLKWPQMQFLPEHTYLHSLRQHYQIISKITVHESHRYYEFTTVRG